MTAQFEVQREVAEARAGVYRFLAQLYGGPPTSAFLCTLAKPDVRVHLETVFGEGARPFLDTVRVDLDPEALRREYDALFRVPGDRYLRPYESVYRGRRVVDGRVVDGVVWGPWTRDVQRLYNLAGAELAHGASDPPDFIAIELDFMSVLCMREADAWVAGDTELAQGLLALQKEFLVEHLSRWVDSLCDEMVASTKLDFYTGLAEMTRAFLITDIGHVHLGL